MSTALVERLQEGRRRAAGDLVPWHCRQGHTLDASAKALEVVCGTCSRGPDGDAA